MTFGVDPIVELGNFQTGEVPDPILYEYQKYDGTVLDLTGATVTFFITPCIVGQTAGPGAGPALLVDGPTGLVSYSWDAATDLLVAGKYLGQFTATKGGNVYISHKIAWAVFTSLEDAP